MTYNKILASCTLVFFLTFLNYSQVAVANDEYKSRPYYGFYKSSLGPKYKRLEHNILGFSIDVPNDWIFGITAEGNQTVAILYPKDSNIGILSNSYETIEIGIVSMNNMTLKDAYKQVMLGMTVAHKNIVMIDSISETQIAGQDAVEGSFSWKSKNGSEIIEWITLVKYESQVRSIAVRAGKNNFFDKKIDYSKLIQTYKPLSLGF